MTDEEVGELWRKGISSHAHRPCLQERLALIRKLVEERARVYDNGDDSRDDYHRWHIEHTLRDFGIDPATWKETK
jgi:hypothetical protein